MIIYRLSNALYKDDLSGNGAKLLGGRWNKAGTAVIYATENISLAVLEVLVSTGKANIPDSYHLVKIGIPVNSGILAIGKEKLKNGWKDDIEYTQWMGNEFIHSCDALLLKVPSAIIDEDFNYIVNCSHPDFSKVRMLRSFEFHFDKRLLLKDE